MNKCKVLQSYLVRFGRRLRLRDGWLLAQRSLWTACLAAMLIQLSGRVWPVEGLWLWMLAPLAGWLLAVVSASLLRHLPPMRVARRVDAELGLKERLATALALDDWNVGRLAASSQPSSISIFQPELVTLQQQDTLLTAQAIEPRCAFPLRWLRRPLLLAIVLVVATAALALWPNPMDAILAERAAVAQAAEEQAEQVERLREEIEKARVLTAEEREELLCQLAELAEQLRANPGDRQEALADFSRVEEVLRQKLDANADARRAALEAMSAQLQALAQGEGEEKSDLSDVAGSLEKLAERLAEMDAAEQQALVQSLAQMAARAAQSGDAALAQALAAFAQASRSGDRDAAAQAAQALAQAQAELADQDALRQILSQLQDSRRAVAQVGQGQGEAAAQGQGQGQSSGQGRGQGQPGSGGGAQADTLPPARRAGKAGRPQGEGQPGAAGELDRQIYVPWERRQGNGEEIHITGADTGQGEARQREQKDPLPGAPGQALVPYHEVYYDYLDAANQAMEGSYIPSGLRDYVRDYFSQLEP